MNDLTRRFRRKYEFRSWLGLLKILVRNRKRRLGVYVGVVGSGNLGDEALFEAVSALFARHLTLVCPRHLDRLYWRLLPKSRVDVILLGGGTLIRGGRRGHLGKVEKLQAIFPKARTVVFGTGVGDPELWSSFGKETDTRRWTEVLSGSDYVGVRGPLSKGFLSEWGVARQIEVIGDPAIYFSKSSRPKNLGDRRIGLNFGPSAGRIFGEDEKAVLMFATHLIRDLVGNGWRVTAFPVTENDHAYMRTAIEMSGCSTVHVIPGFLDLEGMLQALEQQDVFLGEKLHSVVLANCSLTPALMLAYRTKCLDYMLSTGQGSLTFRTDDLDLSKTLARIEALYGDREMHQGSLLETLGDQKQRLGNVAERIMTDILGYKK